MRLTFVLFLFLIGCAQDTVNPYYSEVSTDHQQRCIDASKSMDCFYEKIISDLESGITLDERAGERAGRACFDELKLGEKYNVSYGQTSLNTDVIIGNIMRSCLSQLENQLYINDRDDAAQLIHCMKEEILIRGGCSI